MPGNLFDEVLALRDELEDLKRAVFQPEAVTALPGVVDASFWVTGMADNTATTLFSILTTDEDGSADGGVYSCQVQAVVAHSGTPTASNSAVKSFAAHFGRVLKNDGTGVTTAVSEISETNSAATTSLTRDVGTVTLSTSEANEYQLDVQLTVDLTGSSVDVGNVGVFVRVVYFGFTTAPQVVQV